MDFESPVRFLFRAEKVLTCWMFKLLAIFYYHPFVDHGDGIDVRDYRSYPSYLHHQRSKFSMVQKRLAKDYNRRKSDFLTEFSHVDIHGSVLCLGSRDGAEVDALRTLGNLAIGVDIAYPPNSPFVHYGDFHHLPYPNHSFTNIYTNAFDHTHSPELLLTEIRRVLKPFGHFYLRSSIGYDEGLTVGTFEACRWRTQDELIRLIRAHGFAQPISKPLGQLYKNRYTLHSFQLI